MNTRSAPCTETAATRPCPHCGIVHGYNCRNYVRLNFAAALCVALLLLILFAAVPAVIR